MAKNTGLAVVAYFFGFIGGIVAYVLADKKDRFTRFHALQSIMFCIGSGVVGVVLSALTVATAGNVNPGLFLLWAIYGLAVFILWLLLMSRAYQGKMWKLPIIGDWAEGWSR